jgi:hypothetical protein
MRRGGVNKEGKEEKLKLGNCGSCVIMCWGAAAGAILVDVIVHGP